MGDVWGKCLWLWGATHETRWKNVYHWHDLQAKLLFFLVHQTFTFVLLSCRVFVVYVRVWLCVLAIVTSLWTKLCGPTLVGFNGFLGMAWACWVFLSEISSDRLIDLMFCHCDVNPGTHWVLSHNSSLTQNCKCHTEFMDLIVNGELLV